MQEMLNSVGIALVIFLIISGIYLLVSFFLSKKHSKRIFGLDSNCKYVGSGKHLR